MDRLDQLKYFISQFYSSNTPEILMQIHKFLSDWIESDTVVQDCIQLLSKETDANILFYAASSLCDFLRKARLNFYKEENQEPPENQIVEIGTFVSELVLQYISNESEDLSENAKDEISLLDDTFFRYFLNCIADSCVFSEGKLKLKDACMHFPIEISLRICNFFFEDWNEYIAGRNEVDSDDIEFTLDILREVPISKEWLSLYSALSQYDPKPEMLSEFYPQLHEILNLTDTYYNLIDHIETIANLQYNDYTMPILQFSLEFSRILRELIDINIEKEDIELLNEFTDQLTYLWSVLISFNDETESIYTDEFPLFIDILKEFTIVESVLTSVVQKTENTELWPKLIESMAKFGEVFDGKESYQHYITNIIEFILFGGSINVDLTESQIKNSLCVFYSFNYEEINNYLMNPSQNVPAILTFLSIIANNIGDSEESEEEILPLEIPITYLENIEMFQSSPKDIVYFSLTFIELLSKDEKCVEKFGQLFCENFERFPYECAEGFYKMSYINRKVYFDLEIPQLLFENYEKYSFFEEPSSNDQEPITDWEGEIYISKSPLIFMLPCIIADQADIIINEAEEDKSETGDLTEKRMAQLNGITSHIFDNLMEAIEFSDRSRFFLFLSVMSKAFTNMRIDNEQDEEGEMNESDRNEIIKRFCSLIFQQIMQSSQHLWLSTSSYSQNSLAYYVVSAFEKDFVGESAPAIVAWLESIVTTAPVDRHFEIPKYLVQFFKDMPNLASIIQNCIIIPEDAESEQIGPIINRDCINFAITCLKSLVTSFQEWDESFFILFPPPLLLNLAMRPDDDSIIFGALYKVIDSEKVDGDFIDQLLVICLNEYAKNDDDIPVTEMISKIYEIVGEDIVIQACESIELSDQMVEQLIDHINNPPYE